MSEYFEYDASKKRNTLWAFIAIALIFAVMGGLIAVAVIAPKAAASVASAETPAPAATPAAPKVSALQPAQTVQPQAEVSTAMPYAGGYYNPVPDVAEKLTPSVVGIVNYQTPSYSSYYGPWGRGRAEPQGEVAVSSGSGVIVTSDGYIVTNNHVVDGASRLVVKLPGGDEVEAELVGTDARTDLAVIKIAKAGLEAAVLGDSDRLRVGELAIAIGNPLGDELASTVTVGYISGINRQVEHEGSTFYMVQTDAAINPGNSGGALLNDRGEVVGINTMKTGSSSFSSVSIEGIGFAIPSNEVRRVVDEIMDKGYVTRAGIGISGQDVGNLTEQYNVPEGILVRTVTPGGPAEKAGVREWDIIVAIDGKDTKTFNDLVSYLNGKKVGDQVTLTVFRDDRNPDVKITLTLTDISRLEAGEPRDENNQPQATPEPRRLWPPSGN